MTEPVHPILQLYTTAEYPCSYLPTQRLTHLATYQVPVTRELEDRDIKATGVWRLDP